MIISLNSALCHTHSYLGWRVNKNVDGLGWDGLVKWAYLFKYYKLFVCISICKVLVKPLLGFQFRFLLQFVRWSEVRGKITRFKQVCGLYPFTLQRIADLWPHLSGWYRLVTTMGTETQNLQVGLLLWLYIFHCIVPEHTSKKIKFYLLTII